MYERPPSFTDLLPWMEYNPASRTFLLEDGISREEQDVRLLDVIQNHLFEDRIFKSSRLVIGDNCSIGNMSVVLYDSEMGAGSSISSLSLLMKGESIPPHTQWEGIPIRRTSQSGVPGDGI